MASGFYVLECFAEGCEVEFYLNDVPVVRRGDAIGKQYGGPVNELCVDGTNHLSLLIQPESAPREALGRRRRRAALGLAQARASLSRYPFGAVVGGPDKEPLLQARWENEDDGAARFWPRVVSASADLGPLFGRWGWQDAPRLSLDEATREQVVAFLADQHAALAAGRPDALLAGSGVRLRDLERAYGSSPREKERTLRTLLGKRTAAAGYGMQDLDPGAFSLRLCGRQRLLECIARDNEPILRDEPDDDGSMAKYPMLLARAGDQLEIVR